MPSLNSCKSLIYGPEYEMGQYKAVRNLATMVRDAQTYWDGMLSKLRANPCGDNYDLSGWELAGVVCTSSVIWVELGSGRRRAQEGFYAYFVRMRTCSRRPKAARLLQVPVAIPRFAVRTTTLLRTLLGLNSTVCSTCHVAMKVHRRCSSDMESPTMLSDAGVRAPATTEIPGDDGGIAT